MRFLMMHRVDEQALESWLPTEEAMAKMGAFIQEATENGILLSGEGVHPSEKGALVRRTKDKKTTVTDGPFTEAKEVIGGFAVINAADRAAAVAFAQRYADLFEDEVEIEVRQIVEVEDLPAPA